MEILTESQRELWINLKAEFIVAFEKKMNKRTTTVEECIPIARAQLKEDERRRKLRFTLEEMFNMSEEDYISKTIEANSKRLSTNIR